jgi:hypothetical protein
MLAIPLGSAHAGKYPYAEFLPELVKRARNVLQDHGMPIKQDRSSKWIFVSATPGDYVLKFHLAEDIPKDAVLDVVDLCIEAYEERGSNERYRIIMYRESHEEWRESLFLGIGILSSIEPYMEFTIGSDTQ